MSKSQTLRALVTQRLTAAAEDIFVLFERTIAEYEEELSRSREENQRLLDCQRPRRTATQAQVQTNTLRGISGSARIKVEPEEQTVKEEDELLPEPFPEAAVCAEIDEHALLRGLSHYRDETQEDISPQPHLRFETEDQASDSSDTDNDDDWGAPLARSAAQMDTEADLDHHNRYLSSAPESSAVVNLETDERRNLKIHQGFICSKTIGRTDDLQTHLVVHADDKPYHCSLCNRTFKYFSNLKRHMKTHTGERPYACSVCGRAFMFSCEVKLHMRTHTGEKPYSCAVCNKHFNRSTHLTRHMRTHTGEKPYSCVVCELTFSHMHILKAHMVNTHS